METLIGYPFIVIWGKHGKRYHELGGKPPWPVGACGTGFDFPCWGTPEEARARGLTPCRMGCGHAFEGYDRRMAEETFCLKTIGRNEEENDAEKT